MTNLGHEGPAGRVVTAADHGPLPPLAPRLLDDTGSDGFGHMTHRTMVLESISVTDNGQPGGALRARFFETTAPGPRPLVVVLPIWGSSTYPPAKIVKWLTRPEGAAERFNVLWLEGPEELIDWHAGSHAGSPEALEQATAGWVDAVRGTVTDIRRLIAWAAARPSVSRGRVGLVGFSIGAIVGSLVLAEEPAISSAVLVAGGAHMHQVLTSCRGDAGRFRRAVAVNLGWDRAALAGWLEPRMAAINPAGFPPLLAPERILVIDANRDRCIPKGAREDWWRALGRPERITLAYGHKMSFLAMTALGFHYSTREMVAFLEATLLDRGRGRRERTRPADASVAAASAGPGIRH